MKPVLRVTFVILAVVAAALAGLGARAIRLSGLFSTVTPGFSGSCTAIGGLPGSGDLAIDAPDGLVFIAADDPRAPSQGGIFTMEFSGKGLTRLSGTPANFHPRALALDRATDGSETLMVINARGPGDVSVDIFDLTVTDGAAKLVLRSTIAGGLLATADAIAATGPDSFYAANASSRSGLLGRLFDLAMLADGNVVYFNGTGLRVAVTGLNRPDGLALAPDGSHLYVASSGDRMLFTFETDTFNGNLKQAGTLALPAGPDKIWVDAHGALWVAGHANLHALAAYARDKSAALPPSQIFRVSTVAGIPGSAGQVFGSTEIAAASVGAVSGDHLIIGSALDGEVLDCSMK